MRVSWSTPPEDKRQKHRLSDRTIRMVREAEDKLRDSGKPDLKSDENKHTNLIITK